MTMEEFLTDPTKHRQMHQWCFRLFWVYVPFSFIMHLLASIIKVLFDE